MDIPQLVRLRVLSCQVCVPFDWADEKVIEFATKEIRSYSGVEPTALSIQREGDPALMGDPERQPCATRPGFVHIMLDY